MISGAVKTFYLLVLVRLLTINIITQIKGYYIEFTVSYETWLSTTRLNCSSLLIVSYTEIVINPRVQRSLKIE